MFAWWGRTVYRYRFIVIGVMVALCLGGGVFGISLGKHVTQSGFYDDGSESVKASVSATRPTGATGPATSSRSSPPRRQDRRRPGVAEEDHRRARPSRQADHPDQIARLGRLSSGARQHRSDRQGHGRPTDKKHDVRLHPAQGRRRRHDSEQLQGDRTRPAEAQRRQRPARRPATARQRADRHHRRGPEARWKCWRCRWWRSCCSSCSAA